MGQLKRHVIQRGAATIYVESVRWQGNAALEVKVTRDVNRASVYTDRQSAAITSALAHHYEVALS